MWTVVGKHKVVFASFLLVAAVALSSCRRQVRDVEQGELAARAAQLYYSALSEGHIDDFVDGISVADSTDESYRRMLTDNTKMFLRQQQRDHNGIKKADIVGAAHKEGTATANVFLMLTYGNGNTEQVLVPMTRRGEVWKMK